MTALGGAKSEQSYDTDLAAYDFLIRARVARDAGNWEENRKCLEVVACILKHANPLTH